MTVITKTLVALSLIITTCSSTAKADTYQHIDQLALHIARQAKTLVSESRHYRHTPEYRYLVSDAQDMANLAEHIHELAYRNGSLKHLSSDLADLDAKLHHLEALFDHVERSAGQGRGRIYANTSHVRSLLNSIATDINYLESDVAALRVAIRTSPVINSPIISTPVKPYLSQWGGYNEFPQHSRHKSFNRGYSSQRAPSFKNRGRSSRGNTISFGGGSSRITFGF